MPAITLKADLHGHSIHSDGKNTPAGIVQAAVKNGINAIGLSDHHSVAGWPEFLAEVDHQNANSQKVLAIPGVEITSQQGDVLVAFPDRALAQKFQADYQPERVKPQLKNVIEKYVTEYQAVCVLLHPEFSYIRGITSSNITRLLEQLDQNVLKNVGVEIYNWMAHILPNRVGTEKTLLTLNEDHWHLTTLGNTDFHRAQHVGNGFTTAALPELSSQAYLAAFQQRQMTPRAKNGSIFDFNQRVIASLEADYHGRKRNLIHPVDALED